MLLIEFLDRDLLLNPKTFKERVLSMPKTEEISNSFTMPKRANWEDWSMRRILRPFKLAFWTISSIMLLRIKSMKKPRKKDSNLKRNSLQLKLMLLSKTNTIRNNLRCRSMETTHIWDSRLIWMNMLRSSQSKDKWMET